METIESRNGGMKWQVIEIDEGTYRVKCPDCQFRLEYSKSKIKDYETCPKCQPKVAAIKTDDAGDCIAICEIGTVEFIRGYGEKHNVSERAAVRAFMESVKAHLPDGDPILDEITEESVRAEVRRNTGKKSDKTNSGADRPKNQKKDKAKRYTVIATPESVSTFLGKYLPDYTLVPKAGAAA